MAVLTTTLCSLYFYVLLFLVSFKSRFSFCHFQSFLFLLLFCLPQSLFFFFGR